MTAQLVPLHAGAAPPISIARPVLLVGRHLECDIRIDSPQVSRRHCCLAIAYDRVVIRDLGSRHGIYVNGQIVDEAKLSTGDEVAIGTYLYRFESLEPVSKPAAKSKKPVPDPAPADYQAPPEIIDLEDDFLPLD